MRYRLRTLLIVLAVAPPVLAGLWFAAPFLPEVLQGLIDLAIWIGLLFVFLLAVFSLASAGINWLGNRPK